MTLQDKSLKIIELPEILNLLSTHTISNGAKEAACVLLPCTDFQSVQTLQNETTAAKNMMVLRQSPPFSGVKDIRGCVKRADMGGALNIRELLDVAELLRAAASSISYFTNDKITEPTAIDYLFTGLKSNKFLENKISTSIVSEDELSDHASNLLADIRRHIRLQGEKVRQTLNKIISSPTYAKVLQEPIITIRNDRFVVPVKVEHKSSIEGLIHDVSSSGATQFIEPMSVVNINNKLRELAAEEKQEIERILMELSADVAGSGDSIINDFEILSKLDFIFAKAKLSYKMDAVEPVLSDNMQIKLTNARHPLLPVNEAVPIDVLLGGDFDTLVITGPNTGGKTVTLKTLGLLCLMAACGLHIPAGSGSIVPVLGSVLADIGDEQSIEQSLSTFSSHMTNIIAILEASSYNSLLLFDELGAGTDPVEGAALAISIIEHARKSKALIAATTHYAELKGFALTTNGVMNASCEFDVETLKPTYKLIIGVPGKSNAFAISKRLGLPDKIIEDAKARVSTENTKFEDAVSGLEQTRLLLENERSDAEKLRKEADSDRRVAQELKTKLDFELNKHVTAAKREAASIIKDARKTAEEVIDEIHRIQKKSADKKNKQSFNDEKANLLRRLNKAEEKLDSPTQKTRKPSPPSRDIVPGDRVLLNSIGTQADVISINSDGSLSLQAGIMKITAGISEVSLVDTQEQVNIKKQAAKSEAKLRTQAVKHELDIRGMNVEEALPIMEQFIDNAKMAKLITVTIIHGKGTGVLRKAVHKSLKQDNYGIKSFRLGLYGEGETGVTIVEL